MTSVQSELWDLESLARATRLRDWMFAQFADAVRGRAAEVGAGIGTYSRLLLGAEIESLLLVEPDDACAVLLEQLFGSDDRVTIVTETLPDAPTMRANGGEFDFVLCQNVLEHIDDDAAAVETMAHALARDGTLGLLVPAHPALFGSLDREYGHVRRYTRERVRTLVESAGLELESMRSFNLLGVAGWLISSVTRRRAIEPRLLRAYDAFVTVWRPLEERLRPPWGLSLVVRARRVE